MVLHFWIYREILFYPCALKGIWVQASKKRISLISFTFSFNILQVLLIGLNGLYNISVVPSFGSLVYGIYIFH